MFRKKMLTPICFALTAWAAVESGTHFRRTLENTGRKERIMEKSKKSPLNRRGFLKGAAAGAAALVAKTPEVKAQQTQARGSAALPSARALAAETDPVSTEVLTADHPGSDFMLDVMKSLGFEYIAANPGSSFRALHESIINYGGNKNPELLTCCHEESSVFMADGYARGERKPIAVKAHSTV